MNQFVAAIKKTCSRVLFPSDQRACALFSKLFTLDSFVARRISSLFFLFSPPLHKQDPKVLNDKSYFPYAPSVRCQKGKRRVSFPCREQVFFFFFFFGTKLKCNEVSKLLVSGVSFPKQVSRPPCSPPFLLACVADLASAPLGAVGAHTGWKNRPGH